MKKFLKGFISFLLSLLLLIGLLSYLFLNTAKQKLSDESIDQMIDSVEIGSKTFAFPYVSEEDDGQSAIDVIRQQASLITVSAVNIHDENAQIASEAGLAAVEEYLNNHPYLVTLDELPPLFAEAYTQKCVDEKIINSGSITYQNVERKRVTVKKSVYCQQESERKFKEIIKTIAKDASAFCRITLNEHFLFYTSSDHASSAHLQNGIYQGIEEMANADYRKYLKGFVTDLTQEDVVFDTKTFEQVKNEVIGIIAETSDGFTQNSGITQQPEVTAAVKEALDDGIYKQYSALFADYEEMKEQIPDQALNIAVDIREGKYISIALIICAACAALLLLINRSGGMIYAGCATLLSGAALYFANSLQPKLSGVLKNLDLFEEIKKIIAEILSRTLTEFHATGMKVMLGGGVILFIGVVLTAVFNKRRKAESNG